MTETQPFVHVIEDWLAEVAQGAPPARLQQDVIEAAGRTRQRLRLPWAPERATGTPRPAMLLLAAACVVAVVVATINLLPGFRGPGGVTPASPSASASPRVTSRPPDTFPSPLPSAGVQVAGYWDVQLVTSGDYRGYDMTIDVAASGWFSDGQFGIQKGAGDAPTARVRFRAFAPHYVYADPCQSEPGPWISTATELATAVSSIPGIDASEPTREIEPLFPSYRVAFTLPEDAACAADRFNLWPDEEGRPRTPMHLGDTMVVWIADYQHLKIIPWIEADMRPGASADLLREIDDVVASVAVPG